MRDTKIDETTDFRCCMASNSGWDFRNQHLASPILSVSMRIMTAAMMGASFAMAQQSDQGGKQEREEADQDTKQAAQDTTRATKKTAKKAGHGVKKNTKKTANKSARKTKQGAQKVEDKTQPQ
jgi:hypothetical protein